MERHRAGQGKDDHRPGSSRLGCRHCRPERRRAKTTTHILRTTWPPALRANSNFYLCYLNSIRSHPDIKRNNPRLSCLITAASRGLLHEIVGFRHLHNLSFYGFGSLLSTLDSLLLCLYHSAKPLSFQDGIFHKKKQQNLEKPRIDTDFKK